MPKPKTGESKSGKPMHYSVGAVIEKEGKYLLIDRVHPPFGFAGPAGHVDEGEEFLGALQREVKEETGLDVQDCTLLFEEEVMDNVCTIGTSVHYWRLFRCDTTGSVLHSKEEAKSIGWYSKEELKGLALEPVWEYWFKKLKVL